MPFHPYTERLIASVPELRQGWLEGVGNTRSAASDGAPATPQTSPLCAFLARCPVRIDGVCEVEPPPAREWHGKRILCHHESAQLTRLQTGREGARAADASVGGS